jgi:hypothetical protein
VAYLVHSRTTFNADLWRIITALGFPVEPLVKIKYASLVLCTHDFR